VVIAAGGIDSLENVAAARAAGVRHFLLKPYTGETLLKIVDEVLKKPASPATR
jgi:YesN/AraC family two-component response regulator